MAEEQKTKKKIVKIADLANFSKEIDISETEAILVRGLNLKEMIQIFVDSSEVFLPLYAAGLDGSNVENLAPFLLTAPDLVASIIAIASDDPNSAKQVQERMPATVQLIALSEIWKASVPDPKKARELLSEVMALLQKLPKDEKDAEKLQKTDSPTTLQPA